MDFKQSLMRINKRKGIRRKIKMTDLVLVLSLKKFLKISFLKNIQQWNRQQCKRKK